MTKKLSLFAFAFFLLLAGFSASAEAHRPNLPVDLSGDIFGAPYRIRVPENWNGTLLIYAHGYRDKADHPGEVDNRTADIAPSAALEPVLLAQGYGLAGSAYRDNGWAVEEGINDIRNLAIYFRLRVGNPRTTRFSGVFRWDRLSRLKVWNATVFSMTAHLRAARSARVRRSLGIRRAI